MQAGEKRRRCDRSSPDRGRHAKGLVPVFLDFGKIDDASDQRIESAVVCVVVGDIKPAVGQITEARRKPEPQQVAEPECRLGRATGIGIVLSDDEGAFMVKEAIQHVGCLASVSRNLFKLNHARLYADLTQENSDRRKAEEALDRGTQAQALSELVRRHCVGHSRRPIHRVKLSSSENARLHGGGTPKRHLSGSEP